MGRETWRITVCPTADITDRVETGQASESLEDLIPEYLTDNNASVFDDSVLGLGLNFDFDLENFSSPSA